MKVKKIISVILALVMSFGTVPVVSAQSDISDDSYTPIYTAEDFNNIRNDLDGKYILMNDIDLSVYENWTPIGSKNLCFSGELNGDGYRILNISSDAGVFDCLDGALIRNLGICEYNISLYIGVTNRYLGVIAKEVFNSVFENCYTEGEIFATTGNGPLAIAYDFCPGGLVGFSENSLFKNCFTLTSFSLEYTVMSIYAAGGLVGESKNSEFVCCYSIPKHKEIFIGYGNTEGKNIYVGGLIGIAVSDNIFEHCYYEESLATAFGISSVQSIGVTELSAEELKLQTFYIGFNFESVWSISEKGYAFLDFQKMKKSNMNTESNKKDNIELVAAEIMSIPLKKRIVFGYLPKSPQEIKIKLKYSDGKEVVCLVYLSEGGEYYVENEKMKQISINDNESYGIKKAEYYLGEEEIYLCYKYLAIPSIKIFIYSFCVNE